MESQARFNQTVAEYKGIVKGRMGIPFEEEGISVIAIVVFAPLDVINSLTGKLGNIKGVMVKQPSRGNETAMETPLKSFIKPTL